jgi:ribosomal protein L30
MEEARRNMVKVSLKDGTIHHNVTGHHGAAKVMMAPAPRGTGIIAGGPMRAVFEVMGITDIVAKSHGSSNPYNMVRATLDALRAAPRRPKWRPSAASRSKTSSTACAAGARHGMADKKTVKVQLVRSPIGCKESHRATVRGLGLRKLNSVRELLEDTPAVRGMINKIDYLVKVAEESDHGTQHHQAGDGSKRRAAASVVASARAWARPPVAATRARSRVPVATTRSASKAARCRCSVACPSAASSRRRSSTTPSHPVRPAAPGRCRGRPAGAQASRPGAAIAKVVKVIKSGELTKAVKLKGVGATAGAKAAIEAAGGSLA